MLSLHRFYRNVGLCVFKRNFSAPVAPFASRVTPEDGKAQETQVTENANADRGKQIARTNASQAAKNPIVAAAFASLLQEDRHQGDSTNATTVPSEIDEKIIMANTVNDLLKIPGQSKISRKQALKIVSILAEWSSIQKALASSLQVEDLQTVLGVTANDEAAKLIAGLTMPQMIKVMSSLAQKKKRSTPLLRSLAFNISSNTNKLNLKECGDLLYAMASLNFRDPVLTARICVDVESELASNKDKPAAIGSILTSLSLLRYRDTTILDLLSDWMVVNREVCKSSQISSLLLSLATLNYEPTNMDAIKTNLINSLQESDFIKPNDWLNTVWSLAALNCVTPQHIASVLNPTFIGTLENDRTGELSPATKMKLLNLNACAKLELESKSSSGVSGVNLQDPKYFVPIDASKEKRILIAGMLDALKSLLPSENHVRINQRTSMGFAIDAECVLDSKCLPLAVDKEHPGAKRIALLVHDYHDMCQGPNPSLNGVHALACRLLEKSGYSVLSIPYSEFNTSDKLLKRVEYLQRMFKTIVSEKP
ncbi:protein TBRG4 isoform X2 [Aedes aegypti]|uniref:Uncharacterized protein n=1 Tax=Aedes aegypti TaxID=7159 RepID=A0A6I8TJ36_AEDAE|nr:protein TBRG4 isoform X2 [Aedes aegypti]